jgi:superfamily I DNA and/or RNA helicase
MPTFVISPYRGQVALLEERLRCLEGILVKMVEGCQGMEAERVVLSLVVRADFEDKRRTNVAITRAKFELIVVGNREIWGEEQAVRQVPVMDALAKHASIYQVREFCRRT